MAKRQVIIAVSLIVICLLILSIANLKPVQAQIQEDITINVDGSVTPLSAPIVQTGSTYALTSDINGSITIQRNNIVLNGRTHILKGWLAIGNNPTIPLPWPIQLSWPASSIAVSNVTVENLIVTGHGHLDETVRAVETTFYLDFSVITINASNVTLTNNTIMDSQRPYDCIAININGGSFNKILENNIVQNTGGISLAHTQNNHVYRNNVTNNNGQAAMSGSWGISLFNSSNNLIYENNFIENYGQALIDNTYDLISSNNSFDNGQMGNYWSDYNGNGSYVIDQNTIDHHPLTQQVDISTIGPATPTSVQPNTIPILPIAIAVMVLVIVFSLLLFRRHQKTLKLNK